MDPLDNVARVHAILMTAHSIFKRCVGTHVRPHRPHAPRA